MSKTIYDERNAASNDSSEAVQKLQQSSYFKKNANLITDRIIANNIFSNQNDDSKK